MAGNERVVRIGKIGQGRPHYYKGKEYCDVSIPFGDTARGYAGIRVSVDEVADDPDNPGFLCVELDPDLDYRIQAPLRPGVAEENGWKVEARFDSRRKGYESTTMWMSPDEVADAVAAGRDQIDKSSRKFVYIGNLNPDNVRNGRYAGSKRVGIPFPDTPRGFAGVYVKNYNVRPDSYHPGRSMLVLDASKLYTVIASLSPDAVEEFGDKVVDTKVLDDSDRVNAKLRLDPVSLKAAVNEGKAAIVEYMRSRNEAVAEPEPEPDVAKRNPQHVAEAFLGDKVRDVEGLWNALSEAKAEARDEGKWPDGDFAVYNEAVIAWATSNGVLDGIDPGTPEGDVMFWSMVETGEVPDPYMLKLADDWSSTDHGMNKQVYRFDPKFTEVMSNASGCLDKVKVSVLEDVPAEHFFMAMEGASCVKMTGAVPGSGEPLFERVPASGYFVSRTEDMTIHGQNVGSRLTVVSVTEDGTLGDRHVFEVGNGTRNLGAVLEAEAEEWMDMTLSGPMSVVDADRMQQARREMSECVDEVAFEMETMFNHLSHLCCKNADIKMQMMADAMARGSELRKAVAAGTPAYHGRSGKRDAEGIRALDWTGADTYYVGKSFGDSARTKDRLIREAVADGKIEDGMAPGGGGSDRKRKSPHPHWVSGHPHHYWIGPGHEDWSDSKPVMENGRQLVVKWVEPYQKPKPPKDIEDVNIAPTLHDVTMEGDAAPAGGDRPSDAVYVLDGFTASDLTASDKEGYLFLPVALDVDGARVEVEVYVAEDAVAGDGGSCSIAVPSGGMCSFKVGEGAEGEVVVDAMPVDALMENVLFVGRGVDGPALQAQAEDVLEAYGFDDGGFSDGDDGMEDDGEDLPY